jgi:hypothetical protein
MTLHAHCPQQPRYEKYLCAPTDEWSFLKIGLISMTEYYAPTKQEILSIMDNMDETATTA